MRAPTRCCTRALPCGRAQVLLVTVSLSFVKELHELLKSVPLDMGLTHTLFKIT